MIIIAIILLILGGFSKSVMDRLADNKWNFIVRPANWFDFKSNTWSNKYKNNDPRQGEKFPLSTTVLVFLTDGWHFFQMLTYSFLILGIIILSTNIEEVFNNEYLNLLLVFIISKGIFTISFQLFYDFKKSISVFKSPLKILIGLLSYAIIAGIIYNNSENISVLNFIENISLALAIIGGITAVIGFIYGLVNINK